eukprot:TRINITY_DN18316_c0_g1_i4.p1 TRINITY_DN18316_c0_g1~~TRINITY_DN18316_c0_g1_i4.p1  ORF type:complete len:276 (+),score=48.78 TRINITY_DN18316_c0_g1_i4:37-864(+)
MAELNELKKEIELILVTRGRMQDFETLLKKINCDNMEIVVDILFEQVTSDQTVCADVAHVCKQLRLSRSSDIMKVLIGRCQKEFDSDCMDNTEEDGNLSREIAGAESENATNTAPNEFWVSRQICFERRLAKIMFIGELYKVKMLTARIIHECVNELLVGNNNDSLECLCILFVTVGKDLEDETTKKLMTGPKPGINKLPVYIKKMQTLVGDKRIILRVRRLLQDVIELSLLGWKTTGSNPTVKEEERIQTRVTVIRQPRGPDGTRIGFRRNHRT